MVDDELDAERAVLGDELEQRGDPQGELIGLQLALAALPADAPRLRHNLIARRIEAVLDRHHDALYGALAPHVTRRSLPDIRDPALEVLRWERGFAETIWLQTRLGDTLPLDQAYRAMRPLAIARFVRELVFAVGDHVAVAAALVADPPPALRRLVFGDHRRALPALRGLHLGEVGSIVAGVPTLEELRVHQAINYAPLAAPKLRVLHLAHDRDLTPTFDGDLPALEELALWAFAAPPRPLEQFPALRALAIGYPAVLPGWLSRLAASPRIAQLERLTLRFALDVGHGAELERHRARFEQIGRIELAAWAFSGGIVAFRDRLPANVVFVAS